MHGKNGTQLRALFERFGASLTFLIAAGLIADAAGEQGGIGVLGLLPGDLHSYPGSPRQGSAAPDPILRSPFRAGVWRSGVTKERGILAKNTPSSGHRGTHEKMP